jgi:3-phosphoshikimate 1-carboxyvinyltransferase
MTTPLESASYVDITLDVMKSFGVDVQHNDYTEFYIKGNQTYMPRSYTVEGDYSQSAFFLVAAALGCQCACGGLKQDSSQGDRKIIDILRQCGADVSFQEGVLRVQSRTLTGVTVDISDIPDLVPPLGVLLSFCRGESRITNGIRLRYKESDRLTAVASELNKLGADIQEGEDYLLIRGVESFTGGLVDSWGDHRIAMMLAVAALKCTEPVLLTGSGSVAKSFPDFFEVFGKVSLEEALSG